MSKKPTPKPWEHAKSGHGSATDPLAARFVESLSYDRRLYKHDIAGSIAHAKMLKKVGLINAKELAAIERGLKAIEREIDKKGDAWPGWKVELEDVHMCIEAALIEKAGDAGRKLHTGRSRNDQVATDLLLWLKEATTMIARFSTRLGHAFEELDAKQGHLVMPSYTHMQRAQPIALRGELAAWIAALKMSAGRLGRLFGDEGEGIHQTFALGSGAIAGSSLPLDRHLTQQLLEHGQEVPPPDAEAIGKTMESIFHEKMPKMLLDRFGDVREFEIGTLIHASSIDSTASRDAAVDFVYALAMLAMTLSRWAEQWIIYATTEFGFITLDGRYTTGSSMMPQKRNPDMLELIRGRCGTVYGHLFALLTILKGLPIGYNRDLQEDKRHVFAAYDMVSDCLDMATRIVSTTKFNEAKIKVGLDRGFLDATSLAEYLVTKGVPFRTAHQVVGSLVKLCEDRELHQLSQLSVDDFNKACTAAGWKKKACGKDVYDWLGAENVVKRYRTYGNAGVSGFEEQLKEWKKRVK